MSFSVIAERRSSTHAPRGVCGHDVGIAALLTSSDGSVTQNPRSADAAKKRISRYQRRMDRQHRAASPACFGSEDTHVAGACHWKKRSRRAQKNQSRLARASDASSSPVTAGAAPGTRRAAASTWPGRRRVLLGMHAQ